MRGFTVILKLIGFRVSGPRMSCQQCMNSPIYYKNTPQNRNERTKETVEAGEYQRKSRKGG